MIERVVAFQTEFDARALAQRSQRELLVKGEVCVRLSGQPATWKFKQAQFFSSTRTQSLPPLLFASGVMKVCEPELVSLPMVL